VLQHGDVLHPSPRTPIALSVATCVLASGAAAHAQLLGGLAPSYDPDDPYQVPDAPAPPTLPDLTHRALSLSLETTLASVEPRRLPDGTQPQRVGVWLERFEAEAAVANRRWYLGLSEEVAGGQNPFRGSSTVVPSNPELWGRALWASRAGLAYGGGLAFVPPLVRHEPDSRGAEVQSTVRLVRPWDFPQFADRMLTVRPFVDVRSIDGPVLLQLRQGLDISTSTGQSAETTTATLTSRTTLYVGYRPLDQLGLGLELWEVYFIRTEGIADENRAVFAVSPSVRWMGAVIQPAVSGIFPIDRPLFHAAKGYWAVRLTLAVILDPSPSKPAW
jgi:hypothetical protein